MECNEKNCPYAELTGAALRSSHGGKLDHLEFIFQQRLSLFNTRRDHEWRIFFGVVFLLGAVDYFLMTADNLPKYAHLWWPAAVGVLFISSVVYQWGVQIRNHADRRAMDAICKEICADLPIASCENRDDISSALDCRVRGKNYPSVYHFTYLWAFCCEMVVLLVACALSFAIPFVHEPKKTSFPVEFLSPPLMKEQNFHLH